MAPPANDEPVAEKLKPKAKPAKAKFVIAEAKPAEFIAPIPEPELKPKAKKTPKAKIKSAPPLDEDFMEPVRPRESSLDEDEDDIRGDDEDDDFFPIGKPKGKGKGSKNFDPNADFLSDFEDDLPTDDEEALPGVIELDPLDVPLEQAKRSLIRYGTGFGAIGIEKFVSIWLSCMNACDHL